MILKCVCNDEWMDEKYGKGMRVCNKTKKPTPTYRCTKCKKEITKTS